MRHMRCMEPIGYDLFSSRESLGQANRCGGQGCAIGWSMYDAFNTTVRAAHFDFLPFPGPTPEEVAAANITLSAVGKVGTQRFVDFEAHHFSYFGEQSTEVRFSHNLRHRWC